MKSIPVKITKPQRPDLATCNLTCVLLTTWKRLESNIPQFSPSNGTNYGLLWSEEMPITADHNTGTAESPDVNELK